MQRFTKWVLILSVMLVQVAHAQRQDTFERLDKRFAYGCLRHAKSQSILPAMTDGRKTAKPISAKWIRRHLQELKTSIQRLNKRDRSNQRRINRLREERAALNSLQRHCQTNTFGPAPQPTMQALTPTPTIVAPTATPTQSPTATATHTPTIALPLNTECFDGIDNNGDGKIDFGAAQPAQADFGCFGPNGQESDQDYGYTRFHPSQDSRVIYVSSSRGSDLNSGLSPDTPKMTLVAATDLLRDGFPDWILLRRGDTFDGASYMQRFGRSASADPEGANHWIKSGRSPIEPMVIASYGELIARPIIKAGNRPAITAWNQRNLVIAGLDFYANSCDPNSPEFVEVSCSIGVNLQYSNNNILVEDNRVRYFGGGINVQAPGDGAGGAFQWDNVMVRRNIVEHSYNGTGHSQGMYSSGGGNLLIQENVFSHNGWNEDYRMNLRPAPFVQSAWQPVSDGRVTIVLNGVPYRLTDLNFTTVTSYHDIAAVLLDRLQAEVPSGVIVDLRFTGRWLILRTNLPSNSNYSVQAYSGPVAGTDIHGPSFLDVRPDNPRTPAATIYNRNLYLAQGYSNSTVVGNITASGASGGIQLRMGGVIQGNLTLDEPVAISVGHAENPQGIPFTASIMDNVVLGSSNIGSQGRGFGIGFGGQGFLVMRNIVAHNTRSSSNIEGLFSDTDLAAANIPYTDGLIVNNIIYNWKGTGNNGSAFGVRHNNFANVEITENQFIQPRGGSLVNLLSSTPLGGLRFGTNRFVSQLSTPFFVGSQSYTPAGWSNLTDGSVDTNAPQFPDPERDIASYMALLGHESTLSAFLQQASAQSRFTYRREFTSQAVRAYIQEGFGW